LCGKVVFDPLFLVVFSLNFRFLVAGLKLCVAFEKLRKRTTNFTGNLCQIVACFLQVLVDGNTPLYAFIGTFAESECRDRVNLLPRRIGVGWLNKLPVDVRPANAKH
jgi:hypothetical protein